ncbi:MAG TPA: hypothetical protein VGU67_03040 [Edaphobacter sp.]|nr:hypothetical protein [Edaphobacter sp.]
MLTPYYTTRFSCSTCGIFEMGTPDRPDVNAKCPWCDEELTTVAQCRGVTSRPLPFTTDPRIDDEIPDTALDVINGQVSEKRRRNHANGKSTGRKRGGYGRSTYRSANDEHDKEADRERYQKRIAATQHQADISGKPEGRP